LTFSQNQKITYSSVLRSHKVHVLMKQCLWGIQTEFDHIALLQETIYRKRQFVFI